MRHLVAFAALTTLITGQMAQAASDPGLMLPSAQAHPHRIGAAVQASVAIPLGGHGEETGARISLRAGPSLTGEQGRSHAVRTSVSPMAELSLRPGRSTTWSLAGQPVARQLTATALLEERAHPRPVDQRNMSTWGKVGIGVGVVVIAAGVGLAILIDKIEDNSE
jgi:hypothetical protein